jgi:hypothetical protein
MQENDAIGHLSTDYYVCFGQLWSVTADKESTQWGRSS